jgi:hypothetical protein
LREGCFPGIIWDQREFDEAEERGNSSDEDDTEDVNIGYKVVDMEVETYDNEHSILRCYPTGTLLPQPFVEGMCAYVLQKRSCLCFNYFSKCMAFVLSRFSKDVGGRCGCCEEEAGDGLR